VRVTSDKSDISSSDATKLMDAGKLDVIVTVTKVSEGFDYPPLSCAMWFAPALSPAKILQGNGRITRDLDYKRPDSVLDAEGKLNPSPNTYIIAPEKWYGSKRREA
jgi:superfamily II DNA or RNA helicase